MQIRPIRDEDVEQGVALIKRMLDEGSAHKRIPFDAPAIRGWLCAAVEKPDEFFCVVAEHEGEIVGGMLGARTNYCFSFTQKAGELGLYVAPEHRGGMLGAKLIKSFEAWAKKHGCATVQVGVTIGINNDLAVKLYEKLGFTVEGPMMSKEVH